MFRSFAATAIIAVGVSGQSLAGPIHKTSHMVVEAMNLSLDGVTMIVNGPRLDMAESGGTGKGRMENGAVVADLAEGAMYSAASHDQVSSGHSRSFHIQFLRHGEVLAELVTEIHINLTGVTRCELKQRTDPHGMLSVSVAADPDTRARAAAEMMSQGMMSLIEGRFGPTAWDAIMQGDWVTLAGMMASLLPGDLGFAGKSLAAVAVATVDGPKKCNATVYIHDAKA